MADQTLLDELAALRAQIRQLQAREAALALEVEDSPHPAPRPRWPIRCAVRGKTVH